jgi:hypothetical protein
MPRVTIQVLEGLERGRVFAGLDTPVTIGREDDNSIRLNDERISRFHAKIQHDGDHLILTDLDSTNGTRVNGHPVQMRILQTGDQISVGRCLLLVGGRPGPALGKTGVDQPPRERTAIESPTRPAHGGDDVHEQLEFAEDVPEGGSPAEEPLAPLFPNGPPPLPEGLGLLQTARLSDVLSFVHSELGRVLRSAAEDESPPDLDEPRCALVPWQRWQQLLRLEMDLAVWLREIVDPRG